MMAFLHSSLMTCAPAWSSTSRTKPFSKQAITSPWEWTSCEEGKGTTVTTAGVAQLRYDKDSFPDSSYFNIITSLVQQISTLFPALCPNIMNYYKCSSFLPVRNRNSQCNLKKCIVGKGSYQSVGKVGGQNKLVHLKRLLYTYSKLIGVGVNWIEQHQFIFIYSIYYVMCQREHAHWVMQFSMTHTNLISFVSSTDKPRNYINKLSTRSRAASYSEISPNTEVSCRK